ncbi:alpha-2 adrenergic receptor [Trichonephila clavipes]|nr:alpha-2 adrenergic receptor [Trichonephila clavipes]
MKIGNNGNLVLGPFDESTPCLMIVLMNCQTKLRINHLTAVKSVAILEKSAGRYLRTSEPHAANVLDTPGLNYSLRWGAIGRLEPDQSQVEVVRW